MRRRRMRPTRLNRSFTPVAPPVLAVAALVAVALTLTLTLAVAVISQVGLAGSHHPPEATTWHVGTAGSITGDAELAVGSAGSATTPPTGYWRDTTDNTAYTAGLTPNSDHVSTFDFTIPTGGQISGALPLVQLADGTYTQATSVSVATTGTVLRCRQGTLQSDTALPITYTFFAHISSDGLAAFATFTYVSAQDKAGVTQLCDKGSSQGLASYQVLAGCTATTCSDLASQAGPSVTAYDSAVVTAEQTGNWDAVYPLTSQQITAQYPPQEFANILNQQVESVGKITAISEPPTAPVVQYTPQWQAYFVVQQTLTLLQKGSSHTQLLTSYYLLENGMWQFWFSS